MTSQATLTFPNLVIRASAGTGKTYALSNRYLRLVASGFDCKSILATTFTRKASGEILDRIMERLAIACTGEKQAAELAKQLEMPDLDLERTRRLLRTLLTDMHRLQISTLDAFFYRIAQSFRLELGLPTEWEIAEEQQVKSLHAQIIRDILRHDTVIQLLHALKRGEAGRSVASRIERTVAAHYDVYLESTRDDWDRLPKVTGFNPNRRFETEVARLEAIELTNKTLKKRADAERELIRNGDWFELTKSSLFDKVVSGVNVFARAKLPPEFVAAYQPIIEHCRGFVIDMLSRRNRATYGLLHEFGQELAAEQDHLGRLRFDDVTRKLQQFITDRETEGLSYRLDHKVEHLLLDEFQDTSIAQWNVIRPFAVGTVAEDSTKSFFCVGDLKQAIYGWRNGVAEIFEQVDEQLGNVAEAEPLTKSYRSSPVLIDVVNRVFGNLAKYVPNDEIVSKAVQQWAGRFEQHETARPELPGYFSLEYAPESDFDKNEGPRNQKLIESTVQRIRQLRRDAPGRSIGVLSRGNEQIGKLIFMLRQAGIEASEEGGNPLTDSAAVETILSAITLCDHPGDTIARFHLATGPLAELLELESDHHVQSAEAGRAAGAVAERLRRQLLERGYGATVEKLARSIAGHCTTRELTRLQQLVEQAWNYDRVTETVGELLRPARFVNHIRQEFKASDESSAPVRVMTIHKAKGLEFDIVVLPIEYSRSGSWLRGNDNLIIGRESPVDPVDLVCWLADQQQRALLPNRIQQAFDEQRIRKVLDEMSVLYVAMTRAIHATHAIMSFGCKSSELSSAGVLLATLVPGWDTKTRAQGINFEHGDRNWFDLAEVPEEILKQQNSPEDPPVNSRIGTVKFANEDRSDRGVRRCSPSSLEGGDEITMRSIFRSLGKTEQLQRGSLIHACFESIEWLEDYRIEQSALVDNLEALNPGSEIASQIVAEFQAMLGQPCVRSVLTRSEYLERCSARMGAEVVECRLDVFNEHRFGVKLADRMIFGSIDRLVLIYTGADLVGADVIDYKTDEVDPNGMDQRVEYYRPQINAYRQAIAAIYQLQLERVSGRLVFVEADSICQIDGAVAEEQLESVTRQNLEPNENSGSKESERKSNLSSAESPGKIRPPSFQKPRVQKTLFEDEA